MHDACLIYPGKGLGLALNSTLHTVGSSAAVRNR
jgi:hypothetical protein